MALRVPDLPQGVTNRLPRALIGWFNDIKRLLQLALNDNFDPDAPVPLSVFTVSTLPAATSAGLIYVSDESGGPTVAYADGANWRRVQDNAIVS